MIRKILENTGLLQTAKEIKSNSFNYLGKHSPRFVNNSISLKYMKSVSEYPQMIQIETTNFCNGKCVMCPKGANIMKRKLGNMSFEMFKKIADEAIENENIVKSIVMQGLGEPLMDPMLFKRIKYLKTKSGIYVLMSTNAGLLSKEKSSEILDSGLDCIMFSLDGASKATYEKLRTGLDYDKVVGNIRQFLQMKRKLGLEKPYVIIQFIRCKINKHEEKFFRRQWKQKDVSLYIKDMHDFLDVKFNGNSKNESFRPCYEMWGHMQILWNGDVGACCWDYNGEMKMGNVGEQYIREIWGGKRYKKLRMEHLKGKIISAPCNRCIQPYAGSVFFPWWWLKDMPSSKT